MIKIGDKVEFELGESVLKATVIDTTTRVNSVVILECGTMITIKNKFLTKKTEWSERLIQEYQIPESIPISI